MVPKGLCFSSVLCVRSVCSVSGGSIEGRFVQPMKETESFVEGFATFAMYVVHLFGLFFA